MSPPLRAAVRIGGVSVGLNTTSPAFVELLHARFAGFMEEGGARDYEFDVEIADSPGSDPDADVRVWRAGGAWRIERGDFRAALDPLARRGRIRQSANPYSIDTLLRIVHTLALAPEGGFLLHAASVIREGRAHVFAGASGAGKTTLARLAPADATLLTDEVSYVRREGEGYVAYGTPFAGELARPGANARARLAGIYLLGHAAENRLVPLAGAAAARAILANLLFFAEDPALVRQVFDAAVEAAGRVPVRSLAFVPDERVWELL